MWYILSHQGIATLADKDGQVAQRRALLSPGAATFAGKDGKAVT